MLFEHHFTILELFLKDHVKLKTVAAIIYISRIQLFFNITVL